MRISVAPLLTFGVGTIIALATTTTALQYQRSQKGTDGFRGEILEFQDRLYVPYGPDLTVSPVNDNAQPWEGYGYGLGATEHYAYDKNEKYLYSHSEAGGYITVIDYSALPGRVTSFGLNVGGQNVEVRDIVVCSSEGLLFVTVSDKSQVLMYETVKRDAPGIPTLKAEIAAGNAPDAMKLSNDCSILAVANQNEGTSILAEGAITLVTGFLGGGEPVTQTVRLNGFDDGYLLNNQVHLPLTKNAMTYWSKVIPDLGWDKPGGLIDQYNPAIALDPEFFAFNHDGSELYLNLQDNSALARVETATGTVKSIHGFGAKPMNQGTGVDIVDDGECKLVTSPCLYLNRAPDGIATVEYEL